PQNHWPTRLTAAHPHAPGHRRQKCLAVASKTIERPALTVTARAIYRPPGLPTHHDLLGAVTRSTSLKNYCPHVPLQTPPHYALRDPVVIPLGSVPTLDSWHEMKTHGQLEKNPSIDQCPAVEIILWGYS